MALLEEITHAAFAIVSYAGDAQTDLLAACEHARMGDFDAARRLRKRAHEELDLAHEAQTGLLSHEAGGSDMEVTFIMAHAQDSLMNAMQLDREIDFFIQGFERIARLEAAVFGEQDEA